MAKCLTRTSTGASSSLALLVLPVKLALDFMRTLSEVLSQVENVPDFSGHKVESVNYRNGYGDTPLHIVANWGDCEAIQLLVESGADIDAKGESGFTPLHCAAEQDHEEAVRVLLSLGAKIEKDEKGNTALSLAKLLKNSNAILGFGE